MAICLSGSLHADGGRFVLSPVSAIEAILIPLAAPGSRRGFRLLNVYSY
jgi:hypothetical protein